METERPEAEFLRKGAEKLATVLEKHGFVYEPGTANVSSGGPFATCHFRRGELELGLVVRSRNRLGCPNYTYGEGYVGHEDLFAELGRTEDTQLVRLESQSYHARNGGDPFEALLTDLREVVLPLLDSREIELRTAVKRAHAKWMKLLSGKSA